MAEEVVDSWFNMTVEPVTLLKEQYARKNAMIDPDKVDWTKVGIDWDRVKANDTIYISSKFDLLEWWKNVGASSTSQYRLIFPVVLIVTAVPASNGSQERTFSICTIFDDHLRQRLKPKRFEMAVLLAVNHAFLRSKIPTEEECKDIVKKVISTFSTDPEFDPEKDLGLDPEAENFTVDE